MGDGERGRGLAAVQGWGGGSRDTAWLSGRQERQGALGFWGPLPAGRRARLPSSVRKVRTPKKPVKGLSATRGQCSNASCRGLHPSVPRCLTHLPEWNSQKPATNQGRGASNLEDCSSAQEVRETDSQFSSATLSSRGTGFTWSLGCRTSKEHRRSAGLASARAQGGQAWPAAGTAPVPS